MYSHLFASRDEPERSVGQLANYGLVALPRSTDISSPECYVKRELGLYSNRSMCELEYVVASYGSFPTYSPALDSGSPIWLAGSVPSILLSIHPMMKVGVGSVRSS